MYLLDTNVLSELRKRQKNQGVLDFFIETENHGFDCYISVITLAEIQSGIYRLFNKNDIRQADNFQQWLEGINKEYQPYKLLFDEPCALSWAYLTASSPHNAIDKQIAATALVHDLTLVTRNTKDFIDTGVRLINPFT